MTVINLCLSSLCPTSVLAQTYVTSQKGLAQSELNQPFL